MAPEIILKKQYYGKQIDIFSMGVMLFELRIGVYPFLKADTIDTMYAKIFTKNYKDFWLPFE